MTLKILRALSTRNRGWIFDAAEEAAKSGKDHHRRAFSTPPDMRPASVGSIHAVSFCQIEDHGVLQAWLSCVGGASTDAMKTEGASAVGRPLHDD